uniref:Calponin-homology (CH) domain-containing protein n=1 Tax=Parastrongyloides trichosuri TaxID=131310 RepID=A0A0N5A5J9_PARTI
MDNKRILSSPKPLNIRSKGSDFCREIEEVQKKTFKEWIIGQLENTKYHGKYKLNDIATDLKDGVILAYLIETLSGKSIKVNPDRNSLKKVHCIDNLFMVMNILEEEGLDLVNNNLTDIADGNEMIILGLVWQIILHYSITGKFSNSDNSSLTSIEMSNITENDDVFKNNNFGKTSTRLSFSNMSTKSKNSVPVGKKLLMWLDKHLGAKYGIAIIDFTTSWSNGLAFNALVDSIKAGIVDMSSLIEKTDLQRIEMAFKAAKEHLNVKPLLDPKDIVSGKIDKRSIITYLSQFLPLMPRSVLSNTSIIDDVSIDDMVIVEKRDISLTCDENSEPITVIENGIKRNYFCNEDHQNYIPPKSNSESHELNISFIERRSSQDSSYLGSNDLKQPTFPGKDLDSFITTDTSTEADDTSINDDKLKLSITNISNTTNIADIAFLKSCLATPAVRATDNVKVIEDAITNDMKVISTILYEGGFRKWSGDENELKGIDVTSEDWRRKMVQCKTDIIKEFEKDQKEKIYLEYLKSFINRHSGFEICRRVEPELEKFYELQELVNRARNMWIQQLLFNIAKISKEEFEKFSLKALTFDYVGIDKESLTNCISLIRRDFSIADRLNSDKKSDKKDDKINLETSMNHLEKQKDTLKNIEKEMNKINITFQTADKDHISRTNDNNEVILKSKKKKSNPIRNIFRRVGKFFRVVIAYGYKKYLSN